MSYPDRKPVVLRKPITKEEALKKGQFVVEKKQGLSVGGNKQSNTDINLRKIEESEDFRPSVVTFELAKQIQNARAAKKLTQKELASRCNVPVGTIQSYENTNTNTSFDTKVLQKLSAVLGVTLKKPVKPKILIDTKTETKTKTI
jgi:putative transcription factor